MSNYNIDVNNPTFILSIVSKIEKIVKRELLDNEIDLILECSKKIPINIINKYEINEIMDIVSNIVISEIQLVHKNNNNVDIHELLKKNLGKTIGTIDNDCMDDKTKNTEVNVECFFGIKDFSTLVKKIKEPVHGINTAYFMLDTRYRILENDGTKYFKWNHINNIIRAQGTFNSIGDIRDIISIKLMPFRIPKVKSADNQYKRVSVLIHELSPQSFIAHEDRQYHFLGLLCNKNPSNRWLEIDPKDNFGGEFKFNKPITHLDTITISLASPLEDVIFDIDRLNGNIISYDNPTIIEFSTNHNIYDDDIIYIMNYNSFNTNIDNIVLSKINNSKGVEVKVLSPTTLSIPVDTSILKFNITGTITVTLLSNIIIGVGTNFLKELNIGDRIVIKSGINNISCIIKSITSNTELLLTDPYTGISDNNLLVEKNNIISNTCSVYFGSKRIFFSLEVVYLSS